MIPVDYHKENFCNKKRRCDRLVLYSHQTKNYRCDGCGKVWDFISDSKGDTIQEIEEGWLK